MKKQNPKARAVSRRFLAKLIAAAKERPAIIRELAEKLGVHRQQVEVWLHSDEAARGEPGLGTGLLIEKVGRSIISQTNGKRRAKD